MDEFWRGDYMQLNEFYNKPLNEIVKEMELADVKIHTDDDNIRTIEVKYAVSTKVANSKSKFCSNNKLQSYREF